MSQRFVRCRHCGTPHDGRLLVCPVTGRAIRVVAPPTGPPHLRARARNLLGKTIDGKYVVRGILGEGGMGTVYEAQNLTIGRAVAVKVLHPDEARKKDAVRRFHHEARAAGAIGHPNICEVYDLGTLDDGSPFLVMERLVGETLADRIAVHGGLPFDDIIEMLVQILSGLVAAHDKGIVHRDIKPENVFLTRRVGCPPLVKLLDFGVSKVIGAPDAGRDEDLDLTGTGMVMGTPFYMSPEQARGDRDLDARVDLYACGVVFYEALTGRRPFTASNYNALLLQIVSGVPRPARDLRPALPPAYDAVLAKAMARDREARYAGAAEMQSDLQALRDRRDPAGYWLDPEEAPTQVQHGELREPTVRDTDVTGLPAVLVDAPATSVGHGREPTLDDEWLEQRESSPALPAAMRLAVRKQSAAPDDTIEVHEPDDAAPCVPKRS